MATKANPPVCAHPPHPEPQSSGDRCNRLTRLNMRVHTQNVYRFYNWQRKSSKEEEQEFRKQQS